MVNIVTFKFWRVLHPELFSQFREHFDDNDKEMAVILLFFYWFLINYWILTIYHFCNQAKQKIAVDLLDLVLS